MPIYAIVKSYRDFCASKSFARMSLVVIWFYFIRYTCAFLFLEHIYLYSYPILFDRLFHFNRVVNVRAMVATVTAQDWMDFLLNHRVCVCDRNGTKCMCVCVIALSNSKYECFTRIHDVRLRFYWMRETFPILVREYAAIISRSQLVLIARNRTSRKWQIMIFSMQWQNEQHTKCAQHTYCFTSPTHE